MLSWTRNKMENLKSLKSQNVELVYVFMTGGGGSRKSDLIKTIYHTVEKPITVLQRIPRNQQLY